MTFSTGEMCHACHGRGWLLVLNADAAALELQRCDACDRFESDDEAQRHVASCEPELTALLLEYCRLLITETHRATAGGETAARPALEIISGSLQHAEKLVSQRITHRQSNTQASRRDSFVIPEGTKVTQRIMLDIARQAIIGRAGADGYRPGEYDPVTDDEGYIVSLLNALHQWCHSHGHDWTTQLGLAQSLFEQDLLDDR